MRVLCSHTNPCTKLAHKPQTNLCLCVLTLAQILIHKHHALTSQTNFSLCVILAHKYLYWSTNSHTNKHTRVKTHVREYKLLYPRFKNTRSLNKIELLTREHQVYFAFINLPVHKKHSHSN